MATVSSQTTADDDSTIVSMLSNSLSRQFPWLMSSAEAVVDESFLEEKQFEILDCLNGYHEEVDLWQLRDLALSRGGLVSSSMRKRAWPKLVGAHMQILLVPQNKYRLCAVSNASLRLLHKDVASTLWNLEDQVNKANECEQFRPGSVRRTAKRKLNAKYKSEESLVPDLAPTLSNETETSGDEAEANALKFTNDSSFCSQPNDVSLDATDTLQSLGAICRRPTSSTEQKVLFNIIVSVLRTMPPKESPFWEDDRYKMFQGLSDVAALLLMNLESPSLTSLVLGRLAETLSLRDSMRVATAGVKCDDHPIETVVELVLTPLLHRLDAPLAAHISRATSISSFAGPWINCWFCQSFPASEEGVALASRLVDVFIASHPMMPLYFSVAVLIHHRSLILATDQDARAMRLTISTLLTNATTEALEDMIEVALAYLSRFPASVWIASCKDAAMVNRRIPMVHMLQPQPSWPSTAPTDYALLQQAKAMRQSGRSPRKQSSSGLSRRSSGEPRQRSQQLRYAKARAATGQVVLAESAIKNKLRHLTMLLLLATAGMLLWSGPSVFVDTMRRALSSGTGRQGDTTSRNTSVAMAPPGHVDPIPVLSPMKSSKGKKRKKAEDKAATESLASLQQSEGNREAARSTTTKRATDRAGVTVEITKHTVSVGAMTPLTHPTIAPVLASAFQPTSVQQKLADKKAGKYQPFRTLLRSLARFFSILFGRRDC